VSGFVCAGCGESISTPYRQWLERVEYVRADRKERRHVRVLRALCEPCMEAEHNGGAEQGSLL
jgi:hypothetical protein